MYACGLFCCTCELKSSWTKSSKCAGGREGAAGPGSNVDMLRTHVAEAQARATHIVDEFESMLMVTGGHSMKEVMHIQSQARLASNSPPAATDRKLVGCHELYACAFVPAFAASNLLLQFAQDALSGKARPCHACT